MSHIWQAISTNGLTEIDVTFQHMVAVVVLDLGMDRTTQ